MDWSDLTAGKRFITDLGEETLQTESGRRYAVWLPGGQEGGKHQIAEVSNNLQELQDKYGVEAEYIFQIQR